MKGLIVLDIDETLISSNIVREDELHTIDQHQFDFNFTLDGVDLKKTVIIDDTKEVANRNSKNLIHVNSFQWDKRGSDGDATLLKVISLLEKIKDLPDWTAVRKRI